MSWPSILSIFFFFFNDTATTEIYTLSLHDALPILGTWRLASMFSTTRMAPPRMGVAMSPGRIAGTVRADRKSTRLNSSHSQISYAVFCLKKKTKKKHLSNSEQITRKSIPPHHDHSK